MLGPVAIGLLVLISMPEPRTPLQDFDRNVLNGGSYEPGEIMVRLAPGAKIGALRAALRRAGCGIEQRFGKRPLFRGRCEGVEMRATIATLSSERAIAWVEASWHDELEAVPNDLDALQWYHRNTGQVIDGQAGIAGADLASTDAWDVTAGSAATIVAIIDVGIYPDHLDLIPNLWVNGGEICNNGLDDDNNGYVDDCRGRDTGMDDNDPSPLTMPETRTDGSDCLRWHATFIAGLAGAAGNNGFGLVGTSWQVSLMNVKRHIDSTCRSTTARTVEAIYYAVDNGAGAIGMSFSSTSYSAEFETALDEAATAGVFSAMSAGNGGTDNDTDTRYPNDYSVPRKVIVASTDNRDQLDPGSNYGGTSVTMAAPGTFVVTTGIENNQSYGAGTGTSMSVGFVLGLLPMLKSGYPQLSNAQIYDAIVLGGTTLSNLSCATNVRCVSSGRRLDSYGSLVYASNLYPPALAMLGVQVADRGNGNGNFNPGERGELIFTGLNAGTGPAYSSGADLTLTSGAPEISIITAHVNLGTILPSGSVNLTAGNAPAFDVSPSCSRDFTASFELAFADRLGHRITQNVTADVRCAGMAPPPPDAGFPDSGAVVPDSGAIVDAGTPVPDAGSPSDAAPGTDIPIFVADSGVGGPIPVDSGVSADSGVKKSRDPVEEDEALDESGGCTDLGKSNGRTALLLSVLFLGLSRAWRGPRSGRADPRR